MAELTCGYAFLTEKAAEFFLLDLTQLDGLLQVEQVNAEIHQLFTEAEIAIADSFSFPKRRLEWMGARLAAKCCVQQLAGQLGLSAWQAAQCSILPDSLGIPHLHDEHGKELSLYLSLSHSRSYAGALLAQNASCGIDIQQKTKQLRYVQERFVHQQEEKLLSTYRDDLSVLAVLWTCKEAVKKSLLPTVTQSFLAIQAKELQYESATHSWRVFCEAELEQQKKHALVRVAEHQDYCIACTVGEAYSSS